MRFNLGFFLVEAFRNIRLNLLMSITAVTTTFICILVFGVGLLVSEHVEGVIGSVREDVSVEVFMPGRGGEEVAALGEKAGGWEEVASVERISEEQALAAFKDTFREQPELYENLDRGVLPASLQIQLTNPDQADEVAGKLKAEGFSEENLSYPQQTLERLKPDPAAHPRPAGRGSRQAQGRRLLRGEPELPAADPRAPELRHLVHPLGPLRGDVALPRG